jgi:hypothetical protein
VEEAEYYGHVKNNSKETTNRPEETESSTSTRPKLEFTSTGFWGEPQMLLLSNIFKEPDLHLNQNGPRGIPGLYQVTFVLGKPGLRSFPENEIKFADFIQGDSHLAIVRPAFPAPEDAVKIRIAVTVDGESFVLEGLPNEAGFLAKIVTEQFYAQNRNDAEFRSTRVVQSLLSEFSVQVDIPLQIELTEVTEVSTQNKSLSLIAPFLAMPNATTAILDSHDKEFAHFSGLYREAMVSNTPVYRFLCFYKILEGSRKRRERIDRKLKQRSRPMRQGELIPLNSAEQIPWLGGIYQVKHNWDEMRLSQIFIPEVRGKKITTLFDNKLRPLRDRISHGILDSGEYLYVDDLLEMREVSRWLPFLRCAVRRVLKNDFPDYYLSYLNEDGSIRNV